MTIIRPVAEAEITLDGGWLCEVHQGCTCAGWGECGQHEPGCGLIPIVKVTDLLAESATIERVRVLAVTIHLLALKAVEDADAGYRGAGGYADAYQNAERLIREAIEDPRGGPTEARVKALTPAALAPADTGRTESGI